MKASGTIVSIALLLLVGLGVLTSVPVAAARHSRLAAVRVASSHQAPPPLINITAIAAGWYHTCALTTGGGLKCWGYNEYRQLGDGTGRDRNTPVDVVGLASGAAAMAAGRLHTCALTAGGGVKCWGSNRYGQLGDGTSGIGTRSTPADVVGLTSGAAGIAAGEYHTCALTTDGGVKCWGWNESGQLGDGSTEDRTTPVDVMGLTSGAAAIIAGGRHTCAVMAGGGVKCWGWNRYGQLGDGTFARWRTTPTDVARLASGAAAVTAGGNHTCALTTVGGVKCWGWNEHGQVGDGTFTGTTTPVDVVGLTSGAATVAAGSRHTCAVTAGGGAKCWGDNWYGQVGDGTYPYRTTPVDVVDRLRLYLSFIARNS